MVEDILRQVVQSISDPMVLPALISFDFEDVKDIMSNAGTAIMGIGVGQGDNCYVTAAEAAVRSPLLEVPVKGARGILFNCIGGNNTTLFDVNEAADIIAQEVDPNALIIFGSTIL